MKNTASTATFFHPDFTVGTGITPVQLALADYHRRSGIAPCPEDLFGFTHHTMPGGGCQDGIFMIK
jgi:hypothetical protein